MFHNVKHAVGPMMRTSFEIHDVDLAVVNGIRRVILTNIPVVGFLGEGHDPSFKVLQNDGPLHNEIILHRLGNIPIHMSEEETDAFGTTTDLEEGRSDIEYTYELNVTNTSDNMLNVTTKDMQVLGRDNIPVNMKIRDRLFPANPHTKDYILITRLRPTEKLHIKGEATKKTAAEHAGFCPVSLCSFMFIGDSINSAALGVLERERAYDKNEYGEPTKILMSIETECALSPMYLVDKALHIIISDIRKWMSSEASAIPERKNNGMEFTIEDADDTVGNIIQSQMHNHYIREKQSTAQNHKVTYVGYYSPHPLETRVIVKICIEDHDNIPDTEYVDVMRDSCSRIVAYLERIKTEWNNIPSV